VDWLVLLLQLPLPNLDIRLNAFAFRTVPEKTHSIAAQGGINAAKNYQNDGDSVLSVVL